MMADSFIRVAQCGCEYDSPYPHGRVRKFGDCNCAPAVNQPKLIEQKCIRCGDDFAWKRPRDYCSDSCRVAIQRRRRAGQPIADYVPTCEICGEDIRDGRHGQIRHTECQGKTIPLQENKTCPVCNVVFAPFRRGQRSCSNDCAQKYWKKNYRVPEPWDDQRRARYHKRRALKRKLPADDIRPRDVYERDGWVCHICELPVDESVKWPDPMSPSLDHVIPLSKGGHHVWDNTALAHLDCNVRKGDRVSID